MKPPLSRLLPLVVFTLLLAGCITPGHIREGAPTRIAVGMERDEVVRKLGRPESVLTEGDAEILGYTVERPWWQTGRFRVRLVAGKVQSYEVLDR